MVQRTFARLRQLRPPVRALVLLFWIYTFTGALTGVFIQIFLYQKFTSIALNIGATILLYTGIMVGFCLCGYLAGLMRLNIKHGFLASFIVMGATLLLLLHSATIAAAYVAMSLLGLGEGLFWLTIHTFELTQTRNEERDFYSSVLTAGKEVLSFVGPAVATFLIWTSGVVLGWGNFTLLFVVTPLFYLLGFFCFASIADYRPRSVEWEDVKYFFSDRRNQLAQLYLMGGGVQNILSTTIVPLAVLFILGTALNVGIYSTLLAVLSTVGVLVIAQYRTTENRLLIFAASSALVALATLWLGYELTLMALIIYTAVEGMVSPVLRVSTHVTDLQTMESIGRPTSDFYPTMLLRDMSLWIWRTAGGLVLLAAVQVWGTQEGSLSVGLYMLAGSMLLTYVGAHLLIKRMSF